MGKHLIGMRIIRTVAFVVALALSASAGAADKALTKAELKSLIANAGTKADHERIAQYFDAEAVRYEMEAKGYSDLAQFYNPGRRKDPARLRALEHCEDLSRTLLRAAEAARNLAAEHRGMAYDAKK